MYSSFSELLTVFYILIIKTCLLQNKFLLRLLQSNLLSPVPVVVVLHNHNVPATLQAAFSLYFTMSHMDAQENSHDYQPRPISQWVEAQCYEFLHDLVSSQELVLGDFGSWSTKSSSSSTFSHLQVFLHWRRFFILQQVCLNLKFFLPTTSFLHILRLGVYWVYKKPCVQLSGAFSLGVSQKTSL